MAALQLAQISTLVDQIEQALTKSLSEKLISPLDEAILRESAHCLEAGYREWARMPTTLLLAVRALAHILGELTVHTELNLGPWCASASPGMKSLEWAEDSVQFQMAMRGDALQFGLTEEDTTSESYGVFGTVLRLQ